MAGVVIAGGHTVQDKEPKYGLAAAGFVQLEEMFTKGGAKVGDLLYLTKPLGFGTITTALKQEKADPKDLAAAVKWMVKLNKDASLAGRKSGVRGATDITGYSFIGHAAEMADASQTGLQFQLARIPILTEARKYAEGMIFPGGAYDNRHHYEGRVKFECEISESQRMLLFDPQTSGGLLLAVPENKVQVFEEEARRLGQAAWQVGRVLAGNGITIIQ
jgi:selenide,water dikinase